MKVWVVGRGYPTPANKMWGSFELEQAKLLARNGHEVTFIALTLSFFNRKDPRGLRVFEDTGVNVYAYSHLFFPGKMRIYLEEYEDKCWHRLFSAAEKNQGRPDIIHIHYPSMLSSINEIDIYRRKGVKIIVTEHWSRVLISAVNNNELKRLQYYANYANCFVCVSNSLEESVKRLAKVTVPTEIIPNLVPPIFFEKTKKPTDYFTFVCVGRLVPLKQFDSVICKFLETFKDDNKVRLIIIGAGPERKKLEKICNGDKRVVFRGEISIDRVANEIGRADALVSYSKYETFSAPVAEAWACGKPIIVSQKSGIACLVNDDTGIVIDEKNDMELGQALKYIYNNYNNYCPEKIRMFAKSRFSDVAIISALEHVYQKY